MAAIGEMEDYLRLQALPVAHEYRIQSIANLLTVEESRSPHHRHPLGSCLPRFCTLTAFSKHQQSKYVSFFRWP